MAKMLDINKEEKELAIRALQDKITNNVREAVQFYVTSAIIQGISLVGDGALIEQTQRALEYGIDCLKKDCKRLAGIDDDRIVEAFDIPALVDAVVAPYNTLIKKSIEIAKKEAEKEKDASGK